MVCSESMRLRALVLIGLAACARRSDPAPPRPNEVPPPSVPTVASSAAGAAPVDASAGPHASSDGGGRALGIFVPHPAPCPNVAAGDPLRLAARGARAGLVVDVDGFLRADVGIPEAVALLGRPALCNQEPGSGFVNMHLDPRSPGVRGVTLETHDGDLIGVVVELDPPVPVDLTELVARWGTPRAMPGPHDAFEAGSDVFSPKTKDFGAQLAFARRGARDPITRRAVHEIIFRRTAAVELLPETFAAEDDLVRLVALALRDRAPEVVRFAGTIGVYNPPVGDRVTFDPVARRNVTSSWIDKQTVGKRDYVQSLHATFGAAVPVVPARFAKAVGAAIGAPAPTLTTTGARTRVDAGARGWVEIELVGGAAKAIDVARGAGPAPASPAPKP